MSSGADSKGREDTPSFPQSSKNNSPDWSASTSQISCVRHKPKLFWHINTDLCWKNSHWTIKICFGPLFSRQAAWLTGPFYLGKPVLGPIFTWQKVKWCHQFFCYPDWNFDLWFAATLKLLLSTAAPILSNGTITPLTNFCRSGTDFPRSHCIRLTLVTLRWPLGPWPPGLPGKTYSDMDFIVLGLGAFAAICK